MEKPKIHINGFGALSWIVIVVAIQLLFLTNEIRQIKRLYELHIRTMMIYESNKPKVQPQKTQPKTFRFKQIKM